jgi:hypothetical protein
MGEVFREYWAVIMAGVGALGWLFRLESRSISNEKEIRQLREKQEKDLSKIDTGISVIQADIKKLLERH